MCHKREECDGEDRLSELPDELLVSILSGITMKEAARTSVLSHRWEKLWTFYPCLDLDGSKRLDNFLSQIRDIGPGITSERRNEILDIQRGGYINWVNHILESSQLHVVDEFKVQFDLDERYKPDIDKWVRFALEKKVKRFELDFSSYKDRVHYMGHYNYPLSLEALPLPSSIFLTSLILKMVAVSDQVLENFISNCPFLESLCVGGSRSLVHLRVPGSSLCLKYVEVTYCKNLKSLELHAANLLSLKYTGLSTAISFMNIPNLVELCVGGKYQQYFVHNLPILSKSFSQLQKLALDLDIKPYFLHMRNIKWFQNPILSQLKQLELHVVASDVQSLLLYSPLIEACPSLNRLALKLDWYKSAIKREVRKLRQCCHLSLKVVEMTGFVGQIVDTEFCIYLIKNAKMLEKMIIDPCYRSPYVIGDIELVEAARECAEQLRSEYCIGDKLIIL
ncbi:hypothetical protein CCACVL1_13641 [Corchorus capsularis]|uniref:F-box domain-containing protein n=1 Tax=Corchorus capsularis TaxID=210143 RepID=A0A1R3IA98_COCAP|nr:hypothetical protein CCACVL1_13641 [Corchorus capsularis]